MGNNDLPAAELLPLDLLRVDSFSLTRVIEAGTARAQGLKDEAASKAFLKYAMRSAREGADTDEAHALFTRAQIFLQCMSSCTAQLAEAGLQAPSEENRNRLIYGLAHAHVKMAPRLDGATRIHYNIGEIIGIARSLPMRK